MKKILVLSGLALAIVTLFVLTVGVSFRRPPDAPLLKDAEGSTSYEIAYLGDTALGYIGYHETGEFFVAEAGIQTQKIDANGRSVFSFPRAYEHFRPGPAPFIATPDGVIDLRRDRPAVEPVVLTFNDDPDRVLPESAFRDLFDDHYARCETMFVGRTHEDFSRWSAYFGCEEGWVLIWVAPEHIDVETDWTHRQYRLAGYPARYEPLVLLRDPASGYLSHDDDAIRRTNRRKKAPEIRHREDVQLDILGYDRRGSYDTVAYTGLPFSSRGLATYRLRVAGEEMLFAEMAVKGALSFYPDPNLDVFVPPAAPGPDLVFLEFRPPSDSTSLGSDGLYVVRPR